MWIDYDVCQACRFRSSPPPDMDRTPLASTDTPPTSPTTRSSTFIATRSTGSPVVPIAVETYGRFHPAAHNLLARMSRGSARRHKTRDPEDSTAHNTGHIRHRWVRELSKYGFAFRFRRAFTSEFGDIFGYHFGYGESNTFLFQAVSTGGLTWFASARQTTLLILDNDQDFASRQARPEKTIDFLEKINYSPTIIILGHINHVEDIEELGCKERHQSYAERFPDSRIICRCGTLRSSHVETGIAEWCPGDGKDCETDELKRYASWGYSRR